MINLTNNHRLIILDGPFHPIQSGVYRGFACLLYEIYRDEMRIFSPSIMNNEDGIYDGQPATHRFELDIIGIKTIHNEVSVQSFQVLTMDNYMLTSEDGNILNRAIILTSKEISTAVEMISKNQIG